MRARWPPSRKRESAVFTLAHSCHKRAFVGLSCSKKLLTRLSPVKLEQKGQDHWKLTHTERLHDCATCWSLSSVRGSGQADSCHGGTPLELIPQPDSGAVSITLMPVPAHCAGATFLTVAFGLARVVVLTKNRPSYWLPTVVGTNEARSMLGAYIDPMMRIGCGSASHFSSSGFFRGARKSTTKALTPD